MFSLKHLYDSSKVIISYFLINYVIFHINYYSLSFTKQLVILFLLYFLSLGLSLVFCGNRKINLNTTRDFQLNHLLWLISFSNALGLIFGAYLYFTFNAEYINRHNATTSMTFPLVFIHVVSGAVWLIIGFIQLTKWSRLKLNRHKIFGTIYVISLLLSIFSIIIINFKLGLNSPFKHGSIPLNLTTLVALTLGIISIKRNKIINHKAWMIRSLALGLIMTVDRFHYGLISLFQIPFIEHKYIILLTLIICELCLVNFFGFKIEKKFSSAFKIFSLLFAIFVFIVTFHAEFTLMNCKVGNCITR